ncbi:family S53 protease-like protein [Coniophora puteana RWD-64-598 SS2]|uniref:tripeptidyl-peptidase II n=1 Tax=Coniophora puteana (strain RWD-64-598) TaxID=741705 RepID=A0A5M3MAZ9_CONPW|nr:family S53 protease-like protein [Coniophora puteana RWD-64-598 SS2]EIW76452.1 family S53 protease-like protein [Coniophora puteana RWD-64-598 SS2]
MRVCLLLGLLGTFVDASSELFGRNSLRVKERISAPSPGWVKHSTAHPEHMLQFRISLAQPRFGELEQQLLGVSDPSHKDYGLHLSRQRVQELMAPHPDTRDVVVKWLAAHGVSEKDIAYSAMGDSMTVQTPVRTAEAMFDTDFHVYQYVETGSNVIRTMQYSLPEVLHEHIDLVHPLVMLSPTLPMTTKGQNLSNTSQDLGIPATFMQPRAAINSSCMAQVTPDCLRQLYNIGNYTPSATNGNSIAVTGFALEWANISDYRQFLQMVVPSAAAEANFTVVSIDQGTNTQSKPGPEANLDVQYAFGLTRPMPAAFYTVGGITDNPSDWTFGGATLDFIDFMLNQTDLPPVISTSYAQPESDNSRELANKICQGFAALGARGVSVLYASGDLGVGSDPGNGTVTPFEPYFPASCPYVTSVGMTYQYPEVAGKDTGMYSGGGFSNYFARPSYQDKAVNDYLGYLGDQYTNLYNSSGRGYPDVSAQGVNFLEIYYYSVVNNTGTSASAPTFAAIVALLNDVRANAGKGPLGFLNPWLYASGYTALNDVTVGNNPGCGTDGFNATKGWDPVTGLGTPDFAKMKELVL